MINMAVQNHRLTISISPTDLKLLQKWGAFHGKSPAEFAAQVVASRIEANIELITRLEQVQSNLESQQTPDSD